MPIILLFVNGWAWNALALIWAAASPAFILKVWDWEEVEEAAETEEYMCIIYRPLYCYFSARIV